MIAAGGGGGLVGCSALRVRTDVIRDCRHSGSGYGVVDISWLRIAAVFIGIYGIPATLLRVHVCW